MPDLKFITLEKRPDGIAIVTMNRPEKLNAINWPMHDELEQIFVTLDRDPSVRAIVLTGAGRGFCSGGDQHEVDVDVPSPTRAGRHLIRNILETEVPVIAAVNGAAVGLGATIALYCDVVFADPSARFADTHVNAGVVAGDGGHVIWNYLLGPARAKHYLLTGAFLGASEAAAQGMIHAVTEAGKALEEAIRYAELLASGPREAILWTKYVLNKELKAQVLASLDTAIALETITFTSPERREAVAAFAAKRKRYAEGPR